MSEHKEQKIVVLLELNTTDQTLIRHGLKLAYIFKKELCLTLNTPSKQKNMAEAREKLGEYARVVKSELPGMQVSTLLLSENTSRLADVLAENHEGIIIVANSAKFKKYSGAVTESPIPWLFVHPESGIEEYNKIVQTLDLRKENTDNSLWCSYFGRFNQAQIVAVAANDSSKEGKINVARNVKLSSKLYREFGIVHKIYKGGRSSLRNVFEALEMALVSDCNLFVMLGSSSITPLDYLVGLPERKILKQAGKLPVMVINPRRDNYILCD
ncbi:hypothetical protein [Maribellus sp. YY47]|uniref:hypothetical protein n=1 Tax=Maribellus sp. YY47 TaxID=2929486 RepID=UPI00200137E3|nr:hypothetical protein [Maribellus sp. YY47]MCK3685116.1 hypothetical protein [Maribellus sp. YY47]